MDKRKIIIDTDCGSDDAMAIAMALNDERYEILFFTAVSGNVHAHQAARNTLTTIEHAGTYEPPVYIGCTEMLLKKLEYAYETHGQDGMGDIGLAPKRLTVSPGNGVIKILEALQAHAPGTIDIITLGTLTNIALAMRLAPDTMRRVGRIVSMGTAGLGAGNVSPVAEFNIWQDAEAARIVTEFGVPLVYVGGLVARQKIDEVLDHGFEAVQMGRALLNEPGFVNRMRAEENARCSCKHSNYCIARMYSIDMACHQRLKEELPPCLKKEIERIESRG